MTRVIPWRRGAACTHEVRQAVRALKRGQVVALPTEAGYSLAALVQTTMLPQVRPLVPWNWMGAPASPA